MVLPFITRKRPRREVSHGTRCLLSIAQVASLLKTAVIDCICVHADVEAPQVVVDTVSDALLHIAQKKSSQVVQVHRTGSGIACQAKPRLFALLIGINVYEHSGSKFNNLQGAVADADDMQEFLTATLGVHPSHIRNLRDREATRSGILQAFSDLISDDRIQFGDAIVIFYAGHGSRTDAPRGWEAGGRDGLIEMIIPYNFLPETSPDIDQQGILDITLAKVLWELAEKKGDNVTVISDSCHSGSSTRYTLGLDFLNRGFTLPEDYAVLPFLMEQYQHRQPNFAAGYESYGLASHMLLAACSRTERAQEHGGRGSFTQALLTLLRDVDVQSVTYHGVVEQLPDMPGQHPQCEGKNGNRILFDGKAPRRNCVLYPVMVMQAAGQEQTFSLGGGAVHGVCEGAEFDVFANRDLEAQPLCRLVATTTHACSADLAIVSSFVDQAIPQRAWALQATFGKRGDFAVSICPVREFLHVLEIAVEMDSRLDGRSIRFVDHDQPHELELQMEGNRAVFVITDKISVAAGLTKLPTSVPLDDAASIYAVVLSAADFFFHLRNSNPANPLDGIIVLEAFELRDREPYGWGANLTPNGENLVDGGIVQIAITQDDRMYGFKLVSGWPRDLYLWAFSFNVSDLSVATLYRPSLSKTSPDPSLSKRGCLTFGYGSGGVAPLQFSLPVGTDTDVTYLKNSPFDPVSGCRRKLHKVLLPQSPLWDTIFVAIVQKGS